MNRLPYADISIATVLVVLGVALAAYPWLEGDAFLFLVTLLALPAVIGLGALHRIKPRPLGVVSGQLRT